MATSFKLALLAFLLISCGKNSGLPIGSGLSVESGGNKTVYLTTALLGGFGGVAGADSRCMSDDNYPGSGTYRALLAGSTRRACSTANCSGGASENLDWVLQPNTDYYRNSDNVLIGTTNAAGIFAFPLTNSLSGAFDFYWTGMASDWTSTANNCSNWTNSTSGVTGNIGRGNATSTLSINLNTATCDFTNTYLLCVEQ